MPIFRRTKKIEFTNFNNFKRSRNNLARRTKETKRKNKENKTYSIDEFIKYYKPIPMLKNLIIKLNIPTTDVEFFTDNGKSDKGSEREEGHIGEYGPRGNNRPHGTSSIEYEVIALPNEVINNASKGLTITSNAGTINNNRNKKGTNKSVSTKEVKNKLNNTSKRFKIGVLQIYPGKKAFKYLRVIGHVNLVIIDTQKKHIFHYEPKKKGVMLSIERKFRYQMGKDEIVTRLNELSQKSNNNNNYRTYTYHKFYGNQPSFNKYCSLYIVYAALKFTLNLLKFIKTEAQINKSTTESQKNIDNYLTQLFKSIKQKDVKNLLVYYKNFSLQEENKKKRLKRNAHNRRRFHDFRDIGNSNLKSN